MFRTYKTSTIEMLIVGLLGIILGCEGCASSGLTSEEAVRLVLHASEDGRSQSTNEMQSEWKATHRAVLQRAICNHCEYAGLHFERRAVLLQELTKVEIASAKLEAEIEVLEQMVKQRPDAKEKLADRRTELRLAEAYQKRIRSIWSQEEVDAIELEKKEAEIAAAMFEQAMDKAESSVKAAKEYQKALLRLLQEWQEQRSAAVEHILN